MIDVKLFTNTYPCKCYARLEIRVRGNYCPGQHHANEHLSMLSFFDLIQGIKVKSHEHRSEPFC
jgi:hypothetical protein